MEWKKPDYSKSQIVRAGKTIRDTLSNDEEIGEALQVVDNWRASHAYPLQVFYCYFKRAYNNPEFIIAQRMKRLDSIVKKLQREPTMNLWTMQDLGGCRVIVPTIADVYSVVKKYKLSRVRHILKKEYDYIQQPRDSGYRSYHLVYQYQSDREDTYNRNMLIEIQVRTRLQHLWGTAVETMGLFTNQALKASHGEKDTLRFFTLISSLFAIEENTTTVPETATNASDIIKELNQIEKKHNYLGMLSAIGVAADHVDEKYSRRSGYYILILNYKIRKLKIKFYRLGQIAEATEEYNRIERARVENMIDAVLVSVSSFSTLRAAYPNYFSDISSFVETVSKYISK